MNKTPGKTMELNIFGKDPRLDLNETEAGKGLHNSENSLGNDLGTQDQIGSIHNERYINNNQGFDNNLRPAPNMYPQQIPPQMQYAPQMYPQQQAPRVFLVQQPVPMPYQVEKPVIIQRNVPVPVYVKQKRTGCCSCCFMRPANNPVYNCCDPEEEICCCISCISYLICICTALLCFICILGGMFGGGPHRF